MNRADDEHSWLARQGLNQVALTICLDGARAIGIQRCARRSNDDWIDVVNVAEAILPGDHTMLTGQPQAR